MNLASWLIAGAVAVIFIAVVARMIKRKKVGGCGCGCSDCSQSCACHSKKK